MNRTPTGIGGLDELLGGGYLPGSSILVAGGSGTGKTIFSTQFIYKGAEQYKEPGIYITLEEGSKNIWWNMKSFHWNITKLQQENLVKIYRFGMFSPKEFALKFDEELEKIKRMVEEMGAKRLVIDSTTTIGMFMENEAEVRYNLFKLIDEMKKLDCTTLLIAETEGKRDEFSRFGVEEFVVDGLLALYFMPPLRCILIRKMRGINHDKKVHPFEITEYGVEINPTEQILWESLGK